MNEFARSIIDEYRASEETLQGDGGFSRKATPENAVSNVLHEKLLQSKVVIPDVAADFLAEKVYQEALLNRQDIDELMDRVVETLSEENAVENQSPQTIPLTMYLDRKIQQQELQSEVEKNYGYSSANETVEPFLPYLRGKDQALIAIGVHQGLDVLANSDLEFGVIVDVDPKASYTTRLMLEYAAYHTNTRAGAVPEAQDIAKFFDFSNEKNVRLAEMLLGKGVETPEEAERVNYYIENIRKNPKLGAESTRINSYTHYLLVQSMLEGSWLSSPEKIKKITEKYMNGDIYVIRGDMTDQGLEHKIGDLISEKGYKVDAMYMSNAEGYFRNPMDMDAFEFTDDALMLRTLDTMSISVDPGYLLPKLPVTGARQRFEIEWHYNVQGVEDFKHKMKERGDLYSHPSVGVFSDIYNDIREEGKDYSGGISTIGL